MFGSFKTIWAIAVLMLSVFIFTALVLSGVEGCAPAATPEPTAAASAAQTATGVPISTLLPTEIIRSIPIPTVAENKWANISQAELETIADSQSQRLYRFGRSGVKGAEVSLTPRINIAPDGIQRVFMDPILLDQPTRQKVSIPGLTELDGQGSTYTFDAYIFNFLIQDSKGNYYVKQAIAQSDGKVIFQQLGFHQQTTGGSPPNTPIKDVIPFMDPNAQNKQPTQHELHLIVGGDLQGAIEKIKAMTGDTSLVKTRIAMIRFFGDQTLTFLNAAEKGDIVTANKIPTLAIISTISVNVP
jgi:hypothetical protein